MSIIPINRLRSPETDRVERDDSTTPMAVVIGGVLTSSLLLPYYLPVVGVDKTSGIPAIKRFVAPHGFGIGTVENTRQKTGEALLRAHEAGKGRKLFLIGHSLGGLVATDFACEYPEIVAGVVTLAGAHEGVKHDTIAMRSLIRFINNSTATDAIRHDSSFMMEHRERVRTLWPKEAPLHVIAPAADALLPPPHGFGLLPNDQPTTNRLVMFVGVKEKPAGEKLLAESPGTQVIETLNPLLSHINIPVLPSVLQYIRGVQSELSGQPAPYDGSLPEAV